MRPLPGPRRHAAVPARTPEPLKSKSLMHAWSAGSEAQCSFLTVDRLPAQEPPCELLLPCAHILCASVQQ